MSVFRVSYRYANSLMLLAEEKNIFQEVAKDADLIFNTINNSKELKVILKSPVIKTELKKKLLNEIFSNKISSETLSFIDFVIQKNREDILLEIFKEFLVLCDKKNKILRAKVKTAVELDESLKSKLTSKLESRTNQKVIANYLLDQKIIGGFVVEIDDQVYDASVKHQLAQLRKKFSEEISI
ncbi:MAG: ATP synthase F1 subunit delta [Ignavibacteriales bacterium]|jgi:F-type H+-transporting ATPase subunit delta|nr:ATP synthase F1 subunit delta [Ignavibacteriales bacterium]